MKAAAEYRVATVLLAFGATWGMPLLFTISGMGVWYSLHLWFLVCLLGFSLSGWSPSWGWPAAASPGRGRRRPRAGASAPTSTTPCCRSTWLHETVVVAIAYGVLSWQVAASVQYLVISTASLAATLALYELGVRRPVTRLLFGLRS